jgi:hypothetical protein
MDESIPGTLSLPALSFQIAHMLFCSLTARAKTYPTRFVHSFLQDAYTSNLALFQLIALNDFVTHHSSYNY